MGTNLRIVSDHLGRTIPVQVSSAAVGFPGAAVDSGDRHQFWRGTVLGTTTLMWDAGVGQTVSPNTLVLTRADLLALVEARVAVEWSADAASGWTTIGAPFPLEPITLGHLLAPGTTDYIGEWTGIAKRAWRIRLYGNPNMLAVPQLAGGSGFYTRFEVAKNPLLGRGLGADRPLQGAECETAWGHYPEAAAASLRTALAALNPTWPAETPYRTSAGALRGGLPHYLHDPIGAVFGVSGTPILWNAVLLTPDAVSTVTPAKGIERGPATLRWGRVL